MRAEAEYSLPRDAVRARKCQSVRCFTVARPIVSRAQCVPDMTDLMSRLVPCCLLRRSFLVDSSSTAQLGVAHSCDSSRLQSSTSVWPKQPKLRQVDNSITIETESVSPLPRPRQNKASQGQGGAALFHHNGEGNLFM